jgi:hypothetical protein
MQLMIQRSQRAGGALGDAVVFCLDVRADYSFAEQDSIRRYGLGPQVVYNSETARRYLAKADGDLDRTQSSAARERMAALARGALYLWMAKINLNITVASLGRGHRIQCRDLEELLMAEDTVRFACKNVTRYLEIAATFDGRATVIGYDQGGETMRIADAAPPLLGRPAQTPPEESAAAIRGEWAARQVAMASAALDAAGLGEDLRRETRRLTKIVRRGFGRHAGQAGRDLAQAVAFAAMAGRDSARLVRLTWRRSAGLAVRLKARWFALEDEIVAFAAAKCWTVDVRQVRMVCGGALLLVILAVGIV